MTFLKLKNGSWGLRIVAIVLAIMIYHTLKTKAVQTNDNLKNNTVQTNGNQ